jgi:indolepyruvate ferredoxin oxidoreductase
MSKLAQAGDSSTAAGNTAPTLADFDTAGVTGVDAGNLTAMQSALASAAVTGTFSQSKRIHGFKRPLVSTGTFTVRRGEGVTWSGQAPFTDTPHVFQNLGDGTYFHSGHLALRAAVAAGVNITYKILYNDAVAMTGGQTPEGEINVPHIAAQLRAEGVQRIAIVSDDPTRHRGDALIPRDATFHHRADLDAVQQAMRGEKGVSAIIYDQECATERRRKRKRDLAPKAERRVMINPRVCEDCGDCSRASNCLAVEPVETISMPARDRPANPTTPCN